MAERYEIHNSSSGPVGNNVQIGVNHGTIWTTSSSSPLGVDAKQAEHLRGLADAVRTASGDELKKWGLRDRDALPVRWHTAAGDLIDHWEKIQSSGHPVPLTGQFATIRKTYEAIESRRLVVLAQAGAGKTVLAHRLILDLLKNSPNGPVPVLFSLSGWNPAAEELHWWLAEQLGRDYPFLDALEATTGKKQAEVLVGRNLILPVLDGFDEIPHNRHPDAISQISAVDLPLILTSRLEEYAQAAKKIKAIGGAAAITLEALTLDEVHAYLRHSTSKTRAPAWNSVFDQLRIAPGETASLNLTTVLRSPLMVMLARTTYNDLPGRHPGELLDARRFPTREALEEHLLSSYLNTLYDPRRTTPGTASPNWDPDRARHWLGYLATHLTQRGTHSLTWWQLPSTLHRSTRIVITTIISGLVIGLLAVGFVAHILPHAFGAPLVLATMLTDMTTFGLTTGLALGLINELGFAPERAHEPERIQTRLRHLRGRTRRSARIHLKKAGSQFVGGLAIGMPIGLGFVLSYAYLFPSNSWSRYAAVGLGIGLANGLAIGIAIGIANIVVSVLGEHHSPQEAISPWQLLSTDRKVTIIRTIATVLALLPAYWLTTFITGASYRIQDALCFGLIGATFRLVLSAWGNWLLFGRLWLPLTGRLPWRPKRFLEDAYELGVLRKTGADYQFRHARLQDHLAHRYRTRQNDISRTAGPRSHR